MSTAVRDTNANSGYYQHEQHHVTGHSQVSHPADSNCKKPSVVVLFGKTGDGKSTVGNMLVSGTINSPFRAGSSVSAITSRILEHESHDREWKVIDTVGLYSPDNEASDSETANKLYADLASRGESIHSFCYVKKATKFTKADERCWKQFQRFFGPYEDNVVLIFTSCKQRWISENINAIREYMGRFPKLVGVDFPPSDDDAYVEKRQEAKRKKSLDLLKGALTRQVPAVHLKPGDEKSTRSFRLWNWGGHHEPSPSEVRGVTGHAQAKDPADSDKPSVVVLFGKTGDGKSTVGNMLVSGTINSPFRDGSSVSAITSCIQEDESHDREWKVIDTVGLYSPVNEDSDSEAANNLYATLASGSESIHSFCYVKKAAKFTKADKRCWKQFQRLFGPYKDNVVLVFTSCGQSWIQEHGNDIHDLMGQFSNLVAVDFPPNDDDDDVEGRQEVKRKKSLDLLKAALSRPVPAVHLTPRDENSMRSSGYGAGNSHGYGSGYSKTTQ